MISSSGLRAALSAAFAVAADSMCPAQWGALSRIASVSWSNDAAMLRVFSDTSEYPSFDTRQWLGETCGYYNTERMNADFQRTTGRTRDEWLRLVGWT